MIRIQHLHKSFKKLQALRDVDVQFDAGQSVALVGPNGSGKSTLMKSILGLVFPDSGSILVNGAVVGADASYRKQIGYMPQIIRFPEHMRVKQLFAMMRDIRGQQEQLDEYLYRAFDIPALSEKYLGTLSGGMKQKVNASLALLFDPQIIILDEPTAGLDPLSAEILKEKIKAERARGKLIIISSHIMADLEEITSDVLFMTDGKVICYQSLSSLIADTGTENLSRAIAKVMANKSITA